MRSIFRLMCLTCLILTGLLISQRSNVQAAQSTSDPPLPTTVATPAVPTGLPVITAENAAKLKPVARLGRGNTYAVAQSPDGTTVAVGGPFGVWLYAANARPGTPPRLLPGDFPVTVLAFSPNSTQLAVIAAKDYVHDRGIVQVWDMASGHLVATAKNPAIIQTGVVFSPDGRLLAFRAEDTNRVLVWNISTNQPVSAIPELNANNCAFSPDSRHLAVASAKEIALWDIQTGQRLTIYDTTSLYEPPDALAFTPDGKRLAGASPYSPVLFWDAGSGHVVNILKPSSSYDFEFLAFSPDGQTLASGDEFYMVLWTLKTDQMLGVLEFRMEPFNIFYAAIDVSQVDNVAFSPDGKHLIEAGAGVGVLSWDLTNRQPSRAFSLDEAFPLTDLAVSSDSK